MQFSIGQPDLVRAINQRWLLKFWKSQLRTHRIPQWQSVKTEDLTRLSHALGFLDVVGSGSSPRFQIRFYGEMIAKAYGSTELPGKFLDETIPEHRQEVALAAYHKTRECGYPVYTIHDLVDRNGRIVLFERLLLPFSSDGDDVKRILTSFEFICEDGAFEIDSLLTAQTTPSVLRLSAIIERRAIL